MTAVTDNGEPLGGVRLASGSGSWDTLSDRYSKTGILPVDGVHVLYALMDVPISIWSYKGLFRGFWSGGGCALHRDR